MILISFQAIANKEAKLDKKPGENNFDSTIINQILALPLQNYIGKSVDSLLSVLPPSFSSQGLKPLIRGRIKGIYQIYGTTNMNNSVIEIYIDTFQYHPVPYYHPASSWDMSLLKKETIAYIKVIKNDITCVYGCNNPNYF